MKGEEKIKDLFIAVWRPRNLGAWKRSGGKMKIHKLILFITIILFIVVTVQAQEIIGAAKTGDLTKVKGLIEKDQSLIRIKDETGRTALHWAARGVHVEVLSYLVSQGADVNSTDINGVTPLHSVCSRGHVEAARILTENGADPAATMSDMSTPLHLAVVNGSEELVDLLIQNGAPLQTKDYKNDSPLHAAAHAEKWDVVDLIVNHVSAQNSDILNSADFDGNTILHLACRAGRQETIRDILSKNADFGIRNTLGQTAYNIAVQGGFNEAGELLVQHGADTKSQMFPKLEGAYLGQKAPGTVPLLFAKGIVSTRMGMYGTIVFSPDGREAFWKPESPKMFFSKLGKGMWSAPREFILQRKEPMNVPFYSTDGKRLYFMAGSSQGKESIWYVEKRGENWTEPKPLDSVVNSFPMHWQFSLDKNGDVYFSSDKIYRARFVEGHYGNPEMLPPPINQKDEEQEQYREGNVGPNISPVGDFLIYTKFSASSRYPVQLFISFRKKDGLWTKPQNLSERLQTEGNDSSPRISPDGKYLFFQSVREGSGASRGLYWVSAKIIEDLRPKESLTFTDPREGKVFER
jgi:ankyrin repeat protein